MATVALLAAVCCLAVVPAAQAWAQGGSVSLGISVSSDEAALPDGGGRGSVDLGISVGLDASGLPAAAPGSVPIGIDVGYLLNQTTTFVGYYCKDDGSIDASRDPEVIKGPPVEWGQHPAAPSDDALRRTYELAGGGTLDYWVDGWYLDDPATSTDGAGAQAVSLDDLTAQGDPITLYFLWKKGYAVKLDPNNGDAADVFGGSVESSFVAVPRQVDDPDGFTSDAFPKATRPGYVFAGWYWADSAAGTDGYGRAVLANADGDAVVASDNDGMPWRFFEENSGRTLYAKWIVSDEACVRIHLADARREGVANVDLWFWQGRGYTFARPEADKEVEPGFVVANRGEAPATLDLGIDQNPTPPSSTQYFSGWGYRESESGALSMRYLVTCERREGDPGSTKVVYDYAFGDWAFNRDYVDPDSLTWAAETVPDDAADAPEGQRLATWDALFKTARINVSAPFQVTFTKERGTDPDAHVPYAADDLTWTGDKDAPWVMSAQQSFTNKGDTDVYVSRIECAAAGAESLLPEGQKGLRLFSLGTSDAAPESGRAILFGYAGEAKDVSVSPADRSAWIVLPKAEGANETKLYFGLNIHDAGFDRDAMIPGNEENPSYAAPLANVKYTYAVVN